MDELISALENPSVRGLTVLGGEPMEPENQEGLLPVLKEVKAQFPNKSIWLYTGNIYEELVGLSGNSEKCIGITAELLSLVEKHEIEYVWVKGHAGHEYNERCDERAQSEAAKYAEQN
jgi:organic radical activating enzyme